MSVDVSGLERFNNVLKQQKANFKNSMENPKLNKIIDIAKEEISRAYSGKININIIVEPKKNGFTIYVKDKNTINPKIAFDEFGTGFYAKGSYPGKLPPSTLKISFTSAKKKRSTNGWEYYYPNPDTKREYGRIKGWFTPNGTFHIGQNANATMYNAIKKIVYRMRSEL